MKSLRAILAILMVLAFPVIWGVNGAIAVDVIPGDANGDGLVNMGDTTKLERIILTIDPPYAGADANQDGFINMGDYSKIERIIMGIP